MAKKSSKRPKGPRPVKAARRTSKASPSSNGELVEVIELEVRKSVLEKLREQALAAGFDSVETFLTYQLSDVIKDGNIRSERARAATAFHAALQR